MLGRWRKRREKHRADTQQGDPHHAEPTELVEEEGVVMSGPGGAPQNDLPPE
jgi:hypothetical protein